MSIKCKHCSYKMTTPEFLGHLAAQIFEILKEKLSRGFLEWCDAGIAGFANEQKIACPICEKYNSWIPETVDPAEFNSTQKKGRKHERSA